jgi:hypothetical protein
MVSSRADLIRHLESLEQPRASASLWKAPLRLALVNTRVSSRVGFALVCLPSLFVSGVIVQYGFGITVPGFALFEKGLTWVEHQPYVPGLAPILLVGLPLAALAINLLGILHFAIDRSRRELHLSIKLRVANLVVIALAALITAIVFAHALAERAHHVG